MTPKWDELNALWKEYLHMTLYRNEHLETPLLHYWLGCYLTNKYRLYFSGQEKTFRCHLFIIQPSRTGKGEAMKTTHFLLKKLGLDCFYSLDINASSLMGTIIKDKKNNPIKKYGLLSYKHSIIWDEGSVLLKPAKFHENCTDIVQMATDDPGYVSRGMQLGILEYPTSSSLCAGSYIDGSIESTILYKGLFQRFYLIYHKTIAEERIDFSKNKYRIVDSQYKMRTELQEKIKKLLDSIKIEGTGIHINIDDYKKHCEEFAEYSTLKLQNLSFKDKKQDILESFLSGSDMIIRIAAQRAILFERNVVIYEDFKYASLLFQDHLRNVVQLLFHGEKQKLDNIETKRNIILQVLQSSPLCIEELIQAVVKLNNWKMGENVTRTFIKNMIDDRIIKTTLHAHNKRILSIS